MQPSAPPAALSAAKHAMNAAMKQTQGPPGGGKSISQMVTPSQQQPTSHMQQQPHMSMGKPSRAMNPVSSSMMQSSANPQGMQSMMQHQKPPTGAQVSLINPKCLFTLM